jgi:hypothetical protein
MTQIVRKQKMTLNDSIDLNLAPFFIALLTSSQDMGSLGRTVDENIHRNKITDYPTINALTTPLLRFYDDSFHVYQSRHAGPCEAVGGELAEVT